MRTFFLSLALAALQVAFAGSAAAQIWDLAADWSDDVNPNDVWSYNGPTDTPITTSQADWDPVGHTIFGSAQPAWAAAPYPQNNHVPMLFKRISSSCSMDIPMEKVGMHGNEYNDPDIWVGVVWTSPITGIINVTGVVWYAHTGAPRNADWQIRLNETILTTGNVSYNDGSSSSNPDNLLEGSGGPSALQSLSVSPGDKITLEFISIETWAAFVGADLTITSESTSAEPHPTQYTLDLCQNRPNPFNPTTVIGYELKQAGLTTISIYDFSGSHVKTLLNEYHEPGRFEIVWRGEDERGRRVPSGIYFFRLEVGGFVETKHMTLVR